MSLPKYELFLGFLVNEVFHSALDEVDEEARIFFIQDGDSYLQRVKHNGSLYLGKFLGNKSDLQCLRTIEKNIYSLLTRLVPSYPCTQTPLLLFPAERAPSYNIGASKFQRLSVDHNRK